MDKKFSLVLGFFNMVLSGVGAYNTWPLKVFAGLEVESALLVVVGAAIGTILAIPGIARKKLIPLLLACGIAMVTALVSYSFLLSQMGATPFQLYIAMFLLFIVSSIFFFILTYLEKTLVRTVQNKVKSKE